MELVIDFLYLDLSTCTRCINTNKNLEAALINVSSILSNAGNNIVLNKTLIENEEQAIQHKFELSPTIRINGKNIDIENRESICDSCSDLCSCEEGTSCRVWYYKGKEYNEAPVEMIIDAILTEVYSNKNNTEEKENYKVPQNLKTFFNSKSESSCCDSETLETCCETEEKADCCGETQTTSSCNCM